MRWRRRVQRAGESPTGDWGQGTRGADQKHALHGCDFGRVETQRLVERVRVLPSRKAKDTKQAACGLGGGRVWGGGSACSVQARARLGIGDRACAERTPNMWLMSVTLDVSKLSGWLNASASCRVTTKLVEGDTRAGRREGVGR